jgi:hypothetical protein
MMVSNPGLLYVFFLDGKLGTTKSYSIIEIEGAFPRILGSTEKPLQGPLEEVRPENFDFLKSK